MRQKKRKIVVDDTTYFWSSRSRRDKIGRESVALSVLFERSGPPLLVHFGDTNVVLPRTVREVILFAQERGWSPKAHAPTFEICPTVGLKIADNLVITPPWLDHWAPDKLYTVYTNGAVDLPTTFALPAVEGTLDAFRDENYAIEAAALHTKTFDNLVAALRHDIQGSVSLRTKSHEVEMYRVADIPRIVTTRTWPAGLCLRGFRELDEIWILEDRIETFHHHPNTSVLWTWLTIWPDHSLERRFVMRP